MTRMHSETVARLIEERPALARATFEEACTLLLSGEADVALILLRDLVKGTMGFEGLAEATGKPSKSLHRMLSVRGNPTVENLSLILDALRRHLKTDAQVKAVPAAGRSRSKRGSGAA